MLSGVNLNVNCFVKNYQITWEDYCFFMEEFCANFGSRVCCFFCYYFDLSFETKV